MPLLFFSSFLEKKTKKKRRKKKSLRSLFSWEDLSARLNVDGHERCSDATNGIDSLREFDKDLVFFLFPLSRARENTFITTIVFTFLFV
jgi:hypothetical protein